MTAGRVASATPGMQGFDTDTALDVTIADQLYGAGFRFGVRYLSRTTPQNPGDLSPAEAQGILSAGLGLMAVQHVAPKRWLPSATLGQQYGAAAAANAGQCGFLPGVSVGLDLEEVASYATAAATIAYVNAWAGAVEAAGFATLLYVGALWGGVEGGAVNLSGDDLYFRLRVTRYWRSMSNVPAIPYRGYCMTQAEMPSPIDGVTLDRNVVMADAFGGVPSLLMPT